MANQIVSVHAGIYGMGIYAIMLPSSGFSVAHSASKIQIINQICVSDNLLICLDSLALPVLAL